MLQLVQTLVAVQRRQPTMRVVHELQPDPLGVYPLEQVKQLLVAAHVRQLDMTAPQVEQRFPFLT